MILGSKYTHTIFTETSGAGKANYSLFLWQGVAIIIERRRNIAT